MARALANVLRRVRALAAERRVRFTLKALRELALLGLDATDACETLEGLRANDFVQGWPPRGPANGCTSSSRVSVKPRST